MNWQESRSTCLAVAAFIAVLVGMAFGIPYYARWVENFSLETALENESKRQEIKRIRGENSEAKP